MTISYVTGLQVTGNDAGNVSCAVGDYIEVFAYRDGSTTPPTLAAGFSDIASSGGNTNSSRVGFKIATGTTEATGTWTNATKVIVKVYRTSLLASGYSIAPGAVAAGGASSTTVNYPALTLQDASGSSWVSGSAGHRSVDTNVQNAPAGMTNRQATNATTAEASGHDTNGGVTSWPSTNVSVGGTSSGWRSYVVELMEVPPPPAGWTVLTKSGSVANATSYNTASISPTAGAKVLALITGMGVNTTDRTVPASVGSFTPVDSQIIGTYSIGSVWEYQSDTPFSGAVTIDFGSLTQDAVSWIFIEREGVDSLGTVAKSSGTSTSMSPGTISFGGSTNETFVANFWTDSASATVATQSRDADFYEFAEQSNADSGWYTACAANVAEDQQTSHTSTLSASETWASIGFEVVLASAGGSGSLSAAQGENTVSAAGALSLQAALAAAQGASGLTASGQLALQGVSATTQGGNTVSAAAAGATPITGNASAAQGGNSCTATGALALQGAEAIAQAANVASATGQLALQAAAVSIPQGGNSVSAAGALAATGASTAAQAANTLSATGQLSLTGATSTTQGENAVEVVGVVAAGNAGTAVLTQAANALAASGTLNIQGVASSEQEGNTLSSVGAVAIIGILAVQLDDTTVAATGQITLTGSLGTTQAAHLLSAEGEGGAGGGVYPDPPQVMLGVQYGPNGNDYTGTARLGGGAGLLRRR